VSNILKIGTFTHGDRIRFVGDQPMTRDGELPHAQEANAFAPRNAVVTTEQYEALRSDLEQTQQASAARVVAAHEEGLAAGQKTGFDEGYAAAVLDDARRTEMTRAGINTALEQFARATEALEPLALAIAEAALAKVFGNPDADRCALVHDIVRCQVAQLAEHRVLRVMVSAADFPSDLVLRQRFGDMQDVAVTREATMLSGGCVLSLEFEHVDAGLEAQWTAIQQVLDVRHE
jgi:flagellar biosynthesis/type III secretory pathway protein FliH